MARFLPLAIVAALAGRAGADSAKLAQAREAIEQVHYDRAQTLLVEALQEGGNSPRAVAEIYRLAASTAVVLDHADVGEQYYRRWLAVDPHAELSKDVAPKLREPFVAAKAYMQAHGYLVVHVARASERDVDVFVESDPLSMVATVALADGKPVPLAADHHAHLAGAGGNVVVLDELGNHLLELSAGAVVAAPPPTTATHGTPIYRRWYVWGIPATAVLIASALVRNAANDADTELRTKLMNLPYYGEVDSIRERRDRDATIGNVLLGTSAGLAAVAVITLVFRPKESHTIITPTAAPGAAGLTLTTTW